jgi:hypothetical protein
MEGRIMDVRVDRQDDLRWAVWLDERKVALFSWVGDALDYAEMLGCSPRARASARPLN